jgi:prophage regulatory protein
MNDKTITPSTRLPEPGYARLKDVLKVIPISRSSWYAAVQDGRIQQPIKLGKRTAAWSNHYINFLLSELDAGRRVF